MQLESLYHSVKHMGYKFNTRNFQKQWRSHRGNGANVQCRAYERQNSRLALNYIFCKSRSPLRSRCKTLRSSLRSRSIVYRDLRLPLRSRSSCATHRGLIQHCFELRHSSTLFNVHRDKLTTSPVFPNKFVYLCCVDVQHKKRRPVVRQICQ